MAARPHSWWRSLMKEGTGDRGQGSGREAGDTSIGLRRDGRRLRTAGSRGVWIAPWGTTKLYGPRANYSIDGMPQAVTWLLDWGYGRYAGVEKLASGMSGGKSKHSTHLPSDDPVTAG